jgi:hypothetical protein
VARSGAVGTCVAGRRTGSNRNAISDLVVPGPGEWRARVWLRDAAGNHDRRTAVETRLRYDNTPPRVAIDIPDERDPASIGVIASDDVSAVARGEVEIKRAGEAVWRSLPTRLNRRGFSAFVDDESLPRGTYEVRARAFDRAGNERSTNKRTDGRPATIAVPMRIVTRLVVGKRAKRKGRTRSRAVLVDRPRVRFGRAVRLQGRLTTPGRQPVANAEIEVWERLQLRAAGWRRISTVRTSRRGRFGFVAGRGPARSLRFRYPGTKLVTGRSATVDLRVRAVTSFRPSRRSVVNGEEITFRGRLKGGFLPATSKLVELQAFSRGRWITFATPRANPQTGLWAYRYRFAATRGRVRYRFRARVPKEESYPFETGVSRQVSVAVRGL